MNKSHNVDRPTLLTQFPPALLEDSGLYAMYDVLPIVLKLVRKESRTAATSGCFFPSSLPRCFNQISAIWALVSTERSSTFPASIFFVIIDIAIVAADCESVHGLLSFDGQIAGDHVGPSASLCTAGRQYQ